MKSKYWILIFLLIPILIRAQIWEQIVLPDTLSAYDINAEKDGIILIGATSNMGFTGLFRSTDEGTSWNYIQVDSSIQNNFIIAICFDLDDFLYINTPFGFYRSDDYGETFEKVSNFSGSVLKMRVSPNNSLYAIGWTGILRSEDKAITWDTLFNPFPFEGYFNDIDFGLNGEIYSVGGNFSPWGGGFYRSFENGKTWENIGITYDHLQSVRVNNEGVIVVGGFSTEWIYSSDDQGAIWEQRGQISADVMEVYMENKLIAGRNINGGAGCWLSENWGEAWVSLTDSVLNPHVNQISIAQNNTVYIQAGAHLFKSVNPILGTALKESQAEIKIYPTPTSNKINILGQAENYCIYNLSGQMVMQGRVEKSIDVSSLPQGVYIIKLGQVRKKLVVE